jgi:hypothetical protein
MLGGRQRRSADLRYLQDGAQASGAATDALDDIATYSTP